MQYHFHRFCSPCLSSNFIDFISGNMTFVKKERPEGRYRVLSEINRPVQAACLKAPYFCVIPGKSPAKSSHSLFTALSLFLFQPVQNKLSFGHCFIQSRECRLLFCPLPETVRSIPRNLPVQNGGKKRLSVQCFCFWGQKNIRSPLLHTWTPLFCLFPWDDRLVFCPVSVFPPRKVLV